MRLVSKNIVVESGIRESFFLIHAISCEFFVWVRFWVWVKVCLMQVCLTARVRVRVRVMVC